MREPRFRVLWARAAARDLAELAAFIALDSPLNAGKVVRAIRAKTETLDTAPTRGRVVPELAEFGIRTFRELIANPYRIMYRVAPEEVTVLAVFDGRRDLEEVLMERLVRPDA